MTTNHHIAMQLASERQRDLLATRSDWSLAEHVGRWFRRPLPGRGADGAPAPAFTAERAVRPAQPVRRSTAGVGAHGAPVRRSHRTVRERERESTLS